ncbi:hypothetical protein INS49_012863 [Diaporthe citri]|uniref:uncharacterized protein n=1 Tax=Diaporthe citri TaxID=83186 RepID=UPI001C7F3C4C|nr:uncharacterized protein INS49_012863 [Diaporthe citri]KAG6359342.1 hypothetical protein INS49_012863 [Diaporthe citri]
MLAPTMTTPQSSSADSHEVPAQASQPSSAPENMPLHEALAYIDPDDKTPHDLYLVLIYAAAAHSDVAEMVDRFACTHRDRIVLQREMRELPGAMGSVAQFVPVLPRPPPGRPGRPHGPARPKEVIEAEKAEKAARIAARKEAQGARKAGAVRRKVNIPAKDRSFTYLVRQMEEELGWTGKYDDSGPKQYWSQKKKRQHWHSKAVDVEANVAWMQEQLLQNMTDRERRARNGVVVDVATFGTKKNALFAMKGIINTILVDTGEIGAQLRENWFSTFLGRFKKALDLLSPEELAMLRSDGKWVKELGLLIRAVKAKGLTEEVLEEILMSFAPGTAVEADSSSDEEEGSSGSDSSNGSGDSSDEDSDGALTGGRFLEQVHFEHFDASEAESFEEESSEIG